MKELFTLSGTLNRGQYARAVLVKVLLSSIALNIIISAIISVYFADKLGLDTGPQNPTMNTLMMLLGFNFLLSIIINLAFGTILAIKRLRDIGLHEVLCLLLYVPLANIIFFIYLLSAKGHAPKDESGSTIMTENSSNKTPTGFIIILILLGLGILVLFSGLFSKDPITQVGPLLLQGYPATICNSIMMMLMIAVFIGIIKRLRWGYHLMFWWLILGFTLLVTNGASLWYNPDLYNAFLKNSTDPNFKNVTKELMLISTSFGLVIGGIYNAIVLGYIIKKKGYFVN